MLGAESASCPNWSSQSAPTRPCARIKWNPDNFRLLESVFKLDRQTFSLTLLRRMHEWLFEGMDAPHLTPGRFRSLQNWIGRTRRIEDARYVPPPPHEVESCMRALIDYIRS